MAFVCQCLQDTGKPFNVKQFAAELVNAVWGADFATIWAVLESLSGLPRAEFLARVGVPVRTARRWRKGETIPRSSRFTRLLPRVEELTGISQAVLVEARERSLVKREEGGARPRPAWAKQYALWGLELSHYLTRLTQERGLNYQDAAALVGYPVERWTSWLNGKTVPRMWETKKVWRIIAAPQGVLLAEFLTARNRAARVVQSRRWRLVKAQREVALAQQEGQTAIDALWESAAETLSYEAQRELRDQGDEQRLVEVLARFSPRQWKALKKRQAELQELYSVDVFELARRRHDRGAHYRQEAKSTEGELPLERSHWRHSQDADGKIRSVRPEAADFARERLHAGWDGEELIQAIKKQFQVTDSLADGLIVECRRKLEAEKQAEKEAQRQQRRLEEEQRRCPRCQGRIPDWATTQCPYCKAAVVSG